MLLLLKRSKASQDFLWGFVREQVEEEATVQGILDKIKLGGDVALYQFGYSTWRKKISERETNACFLSSADKDAGVYRK